MMLVSHSRLSIPPETWYLIPLLRRFPVDRPLTADEVAGALTIMTAHYRWPDMRLEEVELRAALSRIAQPRLRDLAEVVYCWHMRAEGKARWGDKTPVYIEIVPELARLFPDARFIHLVRDGRDVAKSYLATDWIGRWLHDNTREWTRALELEQRWSRSQLRQRILQVRYEDLVLETETVLRTICRFIGEEFEPQMLSWERQVDEQVPARELEAHGKLKQRIGAEGVARWQREMSAREQFVCEAFMGAQLTRMGYERRFAGALWTPLFAATRLYCRTVLPVVELQLRAMRFLRNRLRGLLGSK
jgi:hypothetical protein